jgi:hypothetical protein
MGSCWVKGLVKVSIIFYLLMTQAEKRFTLTSRAETTASGQEVIQ